MTAPDRSSNLLKSPLATQGHPQMTKPFNTQPNLIRRTTLRLFRAQAHETWAATTAAA
jgi:hypothetical protein